MRRRRAPRFPALFLGIALSMATTIARADAPPPSKAADVVEAFGFVVGTSMSLSLNSDVAAVGVGLSLGYKIDRVVLAIGVEGSRYHRHSLSGFDGVHEGNTSISSLVVRPEVQVGMVRWSKVELFGLAGLGIGRFTYQVDQTWNGQLQTNETYTESCVLVRAAPGVRYWARPSFGASFALGVESDIFLRKGGPGPATRDLLPVDAVSPLVDLGFLAVF